uniref:No apical meristem-associated C-terminal domain-containing protein n=1 Tax=Tanacetum cinerariifolium TaxID=118510 RepID=A0A699HLN4_TANCI|nr:hypothetical protein [Tanacetum cinerariifolium]
MPLIHAFSFEEMYTPEFSDSFQQNTGSFQELAREDSPVEVVVTSPSKTKKPTRARQKRTIQSDDAPQQIAKQESGASEEDYFEMALMDYQAEIKATFKYRHCWEIFKNSPEWMKTRYAAKKKGSRGSRASGSSSMNDIALARLMVTEMISQEKKQREAFLEIKRREVECRERELRNQKYKKRQDDIRFYLLLYDHLTRDAQLAMKELRAEIKAKYELPY